MPKIDTNLIPNGQKGNRLFASIPSLDFNLREHLLRFCNSYERLPAILKTFRDFKKKRKTAEWFRILGEEWSSCDNVGLYAKKIKSIFSANQRHWVQMMNEKEHKLYHALPKKIVLYRGAGEKNLLGLSWSLSKRIASRFPFYGRYTQKIPLLVMAEIYRSRVVCVKLNRSEREIIALVEKDSVLEIRPLKPAK